MSHHLTTWPPLGFAVDISPDGIRQTAFLAAPGKSLSADGQEANHPGPSPVPNGPPRTVAPVVSATPLRMAASVTKAMVKFASSGFQTADADTHQVRVAQCRDCPHHHGSRCQVCGCFFDKKAWLPHEDCPLGKWSA
jgi:hypothetical protein